MISEAELIEIEGRAEGLADLATDVKSAIGEALVDGDDPADALAPFDAQLAALSADIERLVAIVRGQRKAAA